MLKHQQQILNWKTIASTKRKRKATYGLICEMLVMMVVVVTFTIMVTTITMMNVLRSYPSLIKKLSH